VGERSLRNAFKRTHNLLPCRHLRILRLNWARRALLEAENGLATVTEIATSFGFVELGRFAVEYRSLFGESPSATLRRAKPAKETRADARRPSSLKHRWTLSHPRKG
jgi:AraC-like DNA-binding protein